MSADIQIVSVIGANGQPLPIHGTSIGSNWSAPVKQERADEAEIQELAAKMLETQKAALAKQQQQQAAQLATRQTTAANGMQAPLVNANGPSNIINYLSRTQKLPNGTTTAAVAAAVNNAVSTTNGRSSANGGGDANASSTTPDKKPPCDEESQKGHFGWTTFGKTYIPYIYRQQEKYCSVRMIELKLLGKYLNCLHPDIYSSCTCVRSYYITEAESRLLIEINHKHCDGEFGRDIFTPKDLVVRLSDATKFYQFLDICYRKLISGSKSPSEKCGFIRINKESVVPYTVRNNEQVVPLFYFEGETENLKQKADYLSGWDLAYLKFCCKVQGIRNELFSSENVAVISLTDIKSYFPNGTEFEDYWPSKVVDSNLLIGNRSNANQSAVNWTRQPSQPPPKVMSQSNLSQKTSHSVATAAAVAAQQQQQQQQQQMLKRNAAAAGVNSYTAQTAAAAAAAAAMQQPNQRMHPNATLATVQALTNGLTNGSWMSQPQNNLPLIHAQMLATQAQQSHANSRGQYRNAMENLLISNRQPYGSYNNAGGISMQPVNSHAQGGNAPPPLVRSAAGQNANHMSNIEQQAIMLQQQQQQTQQQQQQQRHITTTITTATTPSSHKNSSLLASPISNLNIPPTLSSSSSSPLSSAHPYSNLNLNNNVSISGATTPTTDYTNLALWNQLTPAQRLLLTQQIKNNGALLGAAAHQSAFPTPPAFPSLPPLDTDLKTMLDYNPNKLKNNGSSSSSSSSSNNNGSGTLFPSSLKTAAGHFTKPSIPPLIPVSTIETVAKQQRQNSISNSGRHASSNYSSPTASTALSCSSSSSPSASSYSTVPLNSTTALQDFEKKFKMTDEMKAVVQKVLSNPDLSTFIQTNSSNTFVPFISPPISPATGATNSIAGGATSLSILSNPNVTITPQLPAAHFMQPNSGGGSGNYSSSPSGGGGSSRHKTVICSTNAASSGSLNIPPSPSTSNSTSTPSPSPTRSSSNSSVSNHKNSGGAGGGSSHHHHNHNHHNYYNNNNTNNNYNNHQTQQHYQHQSPSSHLHSSSSSSHHHRNSSTSTMEVIDLSSPRRSLQAASAYLQQQQQQQQQHQQQQQQQAHQAAAAAAAVQQQQQRFAAAAAAQHHSQQNGGGSSGAGGRSSSSSSSSASATNSASLHLQRHAAMAAAAVAADNTQRLCIIPEIPANTMNVLPYKVQKVYVDNHLVPCINMKAYNDSDQLMTLTDFQKFFFPTVPLEHCKRLIEALGVELYKGNRRQLQILMENDRNHNENIPLVQVRDIMKYMTQLTFMIRNQEQPPSKRTRIS